MTINNELLAKFEGKCWHKTTNEYPFRCAICGQSETDWQGWFICPHNPDYSTSPADRERLLLYLMGQEEMWMQFYIWSHEKKEQGDCNRVIYDWPFVSWLFSPLDGVPRWVSLLSDWLGMEEVREKFGTTEVCSEFNRWHNPCPQFCDKCDDGSGRIRADWAKYVKEGK